MPTKIIILSFSILLFSGLDNKILAENDQTWVVGVGVGIHNFSTIDDARQSDIFSPLELSFAGMTELFGEWYGFGDIGVGIHLISLGVKEEVTFGYSSFFKEIEIKNNLITAQWIPIGSDSYARLGLIGGIGSSEYTVTIGDETSSVSDSATGTASLVGVFIDWGGEDFGARFGYNSLTTALEKMNGLDVDGSGTAFYFNLRWAFK